jgi:hypothetical protein
MSAELAATASATGNDPVLRVARWVIMKVWLGCVLSAGYAVGHRYGWPEVVLTIWAVLGALMLSLATAVLPAWTIGFREYGVGIAVVDVTLRVLVWLGLSTCVVSLLISAPAVGTVAGALWLNTAGRTFGPALRGRLGRRRRTAPGPVTRAEPGRRVPARATSTA